MTEDVSPIVLDLAAYMRGEPVTEIQLRRLFQFGFLMHGTDGQPCITVPGKEALRDNGLM